MDIDLKGKRVLVTGGSGGIGSAIVKAFGEAGASLCVSYHGSAEAATRLVDDIRAGGGVAFAEKADITDCDDVEILFRRMDEELGGIDVLVNCAGIDGDRKKTWEISNEHFDQIIRINLNGTFYCSREAMIRMVESRSGVILNVSSVHEVIPWTGHVAYTAAKAGMAMMTQSMSQEAAEHGVRVMAISPGAIRTPINEDVWGDPEQMEDLKKKIPMNRIGEPGEVAKVALMMCSGWGSYMTGSSVFVDGGMINYPSFRKGG